MLSYKKCLASLIGICCLPLVGLGNPTVSGTNLAYHDDCRHKVKRCFTKRECVRWGESRCFNCNRPQTHQSKMVCGFDEKDRAQRHGYYCTPTGGGCKRWEEREICKWVCKGEGRLY